jgi:hypothetical protein
MGCRPSTTPLGPASPRSPTVTKHSWQHVLHVSAQSCIGWYPNLRLPSVNENPTSLSCIHSALDDQFFFLVPTAGIIASSTVNHPRTTSLPLHRTLRKGTPPRHLSTCLKAPLKAQRWLWFLFFIFAEFCLIEFGCSLCSLVRLTSLRCKV